MCSYPTYGCSNTTPVFVARTLVGWLRHCIVGDSLQRESLFLLPNHLKHLTITFVCVIFQIETFVVIMITPIQTIVNDKIKVFFRGCR